MDVAEKSRQPAANSPGKDKSRKASHETSTPAAIQNTNLNDPASLCHVYSFGKSGYGTGTLSNFSIRAERVVTVACGDAHSALITERGRLFTFGGNEWGQLGLGHTDRISKPTHVASLSERATLVACGRSHTLIACENGKIYGFGSNSDGQLGISTQADSVHEPTEVSALPQQQYRQIACGSEHSSALTEKGQVYMWGSGAMGQLGFGMGKSSPQPKLLRIKGISFATFVSCGYYHTGVVGDKGELFMFGEGDDGKLGLGDDKSVGVPTKLKRMDGHVLSVACGATHSLIVADTGLFACGAGDYGQLGLTNAIRCSSIPMRLSGALSQGEVDSHIVKASCGEHHSAVVTQAGKLYMFGSSRQGQLGTLSESGEDDCFQPELMTLLSTDFQTLHVSCGGRHTLAIAQELALSSLSDDESDDENEELNLQVDAKLHAQGSARARRRQLRKIEASKPRPLLRPVSFVAPATTDQPAEKCDSADSDHTSKAASAGIDNNKERETNNKGKEQHDKEHETPQAAVKDVVKTEGQQPSKESAVSASGKKTANSRVQTSSACTIL